MIMMCSVSARKSIRFSYRCVSCVKAKRTSTIGEIFHLEFTITVYSLHGLIPLFQKNLLSIALGWDRYSFCHFELIIFLPSLSSLLNFPYNPHCSPPTSWCHFLHYLLLHAYVYTYTSLNITCSIYIMLLVAWLLAVNSLEEDHISNSQLSSLACLSPMTALPKVIFIHSILLKYSKLCKC